MNEILAKEFIESNQWTFAKSMADIPHWYIVKQKCTSQKSFEELVAYIRANGYPQKFYSKTFIYCNIGEYKYWTMGNPIEVTTIINRAKI